MHVPRAKPLARAAAVLAIVSAGLVGGCYEEHAPSAQQQPAPQPATAQPQPPTGGPVAGGAGGSALGGARRAAHNTVDSLEQKQQDLEKALENN